jgi:hypothetical protein
MVVPAVLAVMAVSVARAGPGRLVLMPAWLGRRVSPAVTAVTAVPVVSAVTVALAAPPSTGGPEPAVPAVMVRPGVVQVPPVTVVLAAPGMSPSVSVVLVELVVIPVRSVPAERPVRPVAWVARWVVLVFPDCR